MPTKDESWGRRAFQVTASLSFPRKVGTAGDRKARDRVREALTRAGLEVGEERFECSDYGIRVLARWAVVPTAIMLLTAAFLLRAGFPIIAALVALLSVLPAAFALSRATSGPAAKRRRKECGSANILGSSPVAGDEKLTVILMAHYDSKSQVFPIWLRILLFIISGVLIGALLVLIIASAILELIGAGAVFATTVLILAIVLLLVAGAFLLNTAGNLSDGALDNATGAGIITELAERLLEDPCPGLRIMALATGAEEIGLCGAVAFLEAHRREFDPARTVVLNFDGCGGDRTVRVLKAYGLPRRTIPTRLETLLDQAAEELGISFRKIYIPLGMATDLMPLVRAGYPGVDFIGMAVKSHTPHDRINLVNESTLGEYVKLAKGLIAKLAEERTAS